MSAPHTIRALNDALRKTFNGGTVLITNGVESIPEIDQFAIIEKIMTFDAFTEDNDPYGEHDFGSID